MAIINCPECGGNVSDTVKKCPHCGYNIKKYLKRHARGEGGAKKSSVSSFDALPDNYTATKNGISGKRILWLIIFLIVLFLGIGCLIFYEQHRMPNVIGLTENEAKELLEGKNISYIIEEDLSYDYEKNYVFDQSIAAGVLGEKEDTVVIKVSAGLKYIVPDIIGKNINDVENQISNLPTKIEYDGTYEIEEDIIYSMSKEAGEDISQDDSLVIYVSKGIKKTLPNIVGMYKDQAEMELNNLGLRVDFIEDNSYFEEGIVFNYAPKSYVKEGETITVSVSSGKEIIVPDFIGRTKTYTVNQLESLGIEYEISNAYDDLTVDCINDGVDVVTYQNISGAVLETSKIKLETSKPAIKIISIDWDINYANGVDTYINMKNISDKEIAYVTFEVQYFDRMGKSAICEIQNTSKMYLQYTGPLKAGSNSGKQYWRAVIYNPSIAAIRPNYAEVEFTDGTKQKLTYTGRYWYGNDYYGGDLKN